MPADQVPAGLLTTLPPEDGDSAYWKLRPDLIGAGRTFVYTTTIIGNPNKDEWTAEAHVELATGPVNAFQLIPGPILSRNGG